MFVHYVVRWSDLAPEQKRIFETFSLDEAHDFVLNEIDRLVMLKSDYDDTVHFGVTDMTGKVWQCAEVDMRA